MVALLSGLKCPSKNPKTGPMVPVYVMCADSAPVAARRSGADKAVCGGCPVRDRCYVQIARAPTNMYEAYRRGMYRSVDLAEVAALTAGRRVRLGAYGEPAAVPEAVCEALVRSAAGHTGYTHAWRSTRAGWLRSYCQASVETAKGVAKAQALGWNTFRVRPAGDDSTSPGELLCLAAPSRVRKSTCHACNKCGGTTSGFNVTIPAHGASRGRYT